MTVTRTIKTRLAIEGEAEYQAKMRQCSDAIRETSSTLDLVTAKYAENANSIEALTEKGDVLQRMYNQQAEKVKTAADALENARKAQEDYARDIINIKEKLADAEKQMQEFADAGVESGEAYEQLENSIKGLKNQLESSEALYDSASRGVSKWKTEVNKAEAALYKTGDALRKNNDALEEAGKNAEDAGDGFGDMAENFDLSAFSVQGLLDKVKNISPTVAIATTAIIGATKAVYDFAETYQDTASVIGKATGAIGDDLYKLTDSAYRAAAQVDATLDEVAAATGEINTRYGLIGKDLEDMTALFANFADANNTEIVPAVQNVSKIMRNYDVSIEDTGRLMDMLTVAAQKSGISFSTLSSQLLSGKAQFMEFGYTLEESIALIGMAELEGLNLNSMLAGFRTAATQAAKAGKDLPRMLDDTIESIKEAATEQEALNIATEAFGTRAAQEMLLAIRSGRFEIDEWVEALENSQGVMDDTGEATDTFGDKWQQLKNGLTAAVIEMENDFAHLSGAAAEALTTADDTLEEVTRSGKEATAQIDASVAVVSRYIERLKELEDQESLTAEQQAEYNDLVAKINALMPDLNLKIDEQTGLIEGGTKALYENVEAWKEYAKAQAQIQYGDELYQSVVAAEKELLALEQERNVLQEQQNALQAEYDKWLEMHGERLDELRSKRTRGNINASEAKELRELEKAYTAVWLAMEDGEDALEDYDDALADANATVEAATELWEDFADTQQEANDIIGDTENLQNAEAELENYADTLTATAEQGVAALEQLQAEYDEAYAAAYASIDGQLGKWKEFKEVTAKEASEAVDSINTALDSQIQFLESYTENFNNLMFRDIEGIDLLAEKLADGSEESAAILAGLSEMTDEEIENIIDKLADVEEGKQKFADEIALMQTDYEERMLKIQEDTQTAMDEIILKMEETAEPARIAGVNTGAAFNEGLASKLAEARQIAAEFKSIFDSMSEGLGEMKSATGGSPGHSHATGLYSVPYDEYPAILHKGERVLTAAEARIYNDQEKYGNTDNSKTVNVGDIVVNDGGNSRKTARAVKRALREVLR